LRDTLKPRNQSVAGRQNTAAEAETLLKAGPASLVDQSRP